MAKTSKGVEDFKELKPYYAKCLEIYDPKINSNKFWRVYCYEHPIEGHFVVRHWGRNGTKGQSMAEPEAQWTAKRTAQDMADKKVREGYKPEVSMLEKIARELPDVET